jgi:hypothetical protein
MRDWLCSLSIDGAVAEIDSSSTFQNLGALAMGEPQ